MRKIYLSYLFSLGASICIAQPTLTVSGNSPMPGVDFTVHYDTWQSEGNGGANQTWDYSGLTSDSTKTISYVDPMSTPSGASFPNAEVCQVDYSGYIYYDYDNNNWDYIGAEAAGTVISSTDPATFLELPLTYGDSWSDTRASTMQFGTRAGTISGNADGYGTLILPWGTINDVLRIHVEEDYTDNVFITIDYDFDTFWFMKPGIPYPLLLLQTLNVTPSLGAPSQILALQYADESAVGIGEEIEIIGSMSVFPSPAEDNATLEYTLAAGDAMTLSIVEMTGRTVAEVALGRKAPGIHRENISVSGLTSGAYFVQLQGSQTQRIERLIVQ